MTPPPLGLYVHVPWCVRKCPYCDFNSHPLRAALPAEAYVDALLADLDTESSRVGGRVVRSVFVGGGTPSLLEPALVARLLAGVRARVRVHPRAEITLEANPGASDAARFEGYRVAGVNRLSIGVQSFDDTLLGRIGRIHDGAAAVHAARAARAAGFANVNLDLMFALPGQSHADAVADVERAIVLEPEHVSHYQLAIEANTAFAHAPPRLPGPDAAWSMQLACGRRLAAAGYRRYEIAAWARRGAACRHNANYWRFGDYLGVGAGAHGKLTDPVTGAVERSVRERHPRRYLAAARAGRAVVSRRVVRREDLVLELAMNVLRLCAGMPARLAAERIGLPVSAIRGALESARERGLVARDRRRLRATARGLRFLDDVLVDLVPDPVPERGATLNAAPAADPVVP